MIPWPGQSFGLVLGKALQSVGFHECLFWLLYYKQCCCCSAAKLCPTLYDPMNCSTPGPSSYTVSRSLPKLMSIESVMPFNYLTLCRPFLLLPSIFPSIGVFPNVSALPFRWPKFWSISFSVSPSNEYLGLISFRIDWLDLLAIQGTLKSLLQHHSSKASVLQCSAFLMVQLSHPNMTTGKPQL